MSEPVFECLEGDGPLVATAIHDGHALRDEVAAIIALSDAGRRREEDPFTAGWTVVAPTRVIGRRSRFEVDMNRPRDKAVYRIPEDAWGLHVWTVEPPGDLVERSLAEYDAFYAEVMALLRRVESRHGRFAVYDLHTYNHRRAGPDGPVADQEGNPDVNIGTGTLADRLHWAPVIDRFMSDLAAFDFRGRRLDVRENVKFRGGNFSRTIHETFPETGLSIAIEFKKFFMDEWTGEPDPAETEAIRAALAATVPGVLEALNMAPPAER